MGKAQAAWRFLARAELWLSEQPGYTVSWEQDTEYDPTDYDCEMPDIAWRCTVTANGESACLCGITFDGDAEPFGKPYARVVVAELAQELMDE